MGDSSIVTVFVEGEYAKSERRFDKGMTIRKLKVCHRRNPRFQHLFRSSDAWFTPMQLLGTHGAVDGRAGRVYEDGAV